MNEITTLTFISINYFSCPPLKFFPVPTLLIASTGTRYTIAVYAIYHYCCWIQSLFLSLSFILFAPKRKETQNRRMHIIRSAAFVWIDWILQRLVFPFFFLCAHFSHTAPHNYSVSLHGKLNRTRIQFALLFPVPGERRRKKLHKNRNWIRVKWNIACTKFYCPLLTNFIENVRRFPFHLTIILVDVFHLFDFILVLSAIESGHTRYPGRKYIDLNLI